MTHDGHGPLTVVIGGNGRLGRAVARSVLSGGGRVRVAVRDPAKVADLIADGAQVATIDLRHEASFQDALSGADVVVTAVQGLTARASSDIDRVDVRGHERLIDTAAQLEVRRFVYVSAQGATLDHPAPFWRAKARVERHLTSSGIVHTILRPSAFMDLYAHDLIGKAVLAGKTVRILGSGEFRRNLVAVEDVAAAVRCAIDDHGATSTIIDVEGPDNATEREIASLYARLSGRPAKVSALPERLLNPLAALIAPFHAGIANVLRLPLQLEASASVTGDSGQLAALIGRSPMSLHDFVAGQVASQPSTS